MSRLKVLGAMSGIPDPIICCLRRAEGLSVRLLFVIRGLDLRSLELPITSAEADIGLSLAAEASLGSEAKKFGDSEKSCATCHWSIDKMKTSDWSLPG